MIDSIDDTHGEKLHIEFLLLQIYCLHNQLNLRNSITLIK